MPTTTKKTTTTTTTTTRRIRRRKRRRRTKTRTISTRCLTNTWGRGCYHTAIGTSKYLGWFQAQLKCETLKSGNSSSYAKGKRKDNIFVRKRKEPYCNEKEYQQNSLTKSTFTGGLKIDMYRVDVDALDIDCCLAFKQRTPASTKQNSNLSNHHLLRLHHSMLWVNSTFSTCSAFRNDSLGFIGAGTCRSKLARCSRGGRENGEVGMEGLCWNDVGYLNAI